MFVFDLLGVQNRDHGERGIARYLLSLAAAIESLDPGLVDHYLVHSHLPLPGTLDPLLATGKVIDAADFARSVPTRGGVFLAGSLLERSEPDYRVIPLWARGQEWTVSAVLYDLIPLLFPEEYLAEATEKYWMHSRYSMYGLCDRVLAISASTAGDAEAILGIERSRISVIGAGAAERFRPLQPGDISQADEIIKDSIGVDPGYILVPTGIDPRKNNDRVLAAYARLEAPIRANHPLVLSSRLTDPDRIRLTARAFDLGVADRLVLPGFVPDELLVALYQRAALVVVASLYEGFGLPALEAKACWAPVIVSNTSSLIEVVPEPSARFDPESVESIANRMETALSDPDDTDRLRSTPAGPFSWESSARAVAGALAPHAAPSLADQRSRVAIVATDPSLQGRAGLEVSSLISRLGDRASVTVYAPTGGGASDQTHALTELGFDERANGAYQQVIYLLDSSPPTSALLDMLRQRPGSIHLLDLDLTPVYNARPEPTGHQLERWYPGRYRPSLSSQERIEADEAHRFGILMLREAVELATEVLVPDEESATRVLLDTGVAAIPLGRHPVPLAG